MSLEPKRLPLVVDQSNRGDSFTSLVKDAGILNGYVDKIGQDELHVKKRPGLSPYLVTPPYDASVVTNGQGCYQWNNYIWWIANGVLYRNANSLASVTIGNVNATGIYQFSTSQGGTPKLVFDNGSFAYTYDPVNGIVQITNANFPANRAQGIQYLDGYTNVVTVTGQVYSSAIDDPQTWTANYVSAQIESGQAVYMSRQSLYIVIFKQFSTEFFYDAANAVGSPLGPYQSGTLNIGCADAGSVARSEDLICWISNTKDGGKSVYSMYNLQPNKISNSSVERLLEKAWTGQVNSFMIKFDGHTFYGITLDSVLSPNQVTLVYDFQSQLWYRWHLFSGSNTGIPFYDNGTIVACTTDQFGSAVFQLSNGYLYTFDLDKFIDTMDVSSTSQITMPINFELITPSFDGGNRLKKYLSRMDIIGDQAGVGDLMITRSEDDYQTWSSPRYVNMSKKNPRITKCGSFTKAAWRFKHLAPTSLRIRAVELFVELGTL